MSLGRKVTKSQAGGVQLIEFSMLPEYRDGLRDSILQIHSRKIDSRKKNRLLAQAVSDNFPEEILEEVKDYYVEETTTAQGLKSVFHIHNLPVAGEEVIPKGIKEGFARYPAFIINEVVKGILLYLEPNKKIDPANLVRRKGDKLKINSLDWHSDSYNLSSLAGVINKGNAKTKFGDFETALIASGIVENMEELDDNLQIMLALIEVKQPKSKKEFQEILDYDPAFKSSFDVDLIGTIARKWLPAIKRYSLEAEIEAGSCLLWPNRAIYHRANVDNELATTSLRKGDLTRIAVFQGIEL